MGPQGLKTVEVGGPIWVNDVHLARQPAGQDAGIGPLVFAPGERPQLSKPLVRVLPHYIVQGPTSLHRDHIAKKPAFARQAATRLLDCGLCESSGISRG